jgi:hypothetical protein
MCSIITTGKLKKAKLENLIRLANALGLNVEGMRHPQIARLVRWRITRETHRFADAAKKADYQAMWENM